MRSLHKYIGKIALLAGCFCMVLPFSGRAQSFEKQHKRLFRSYKKIEEGKTLTQFKDGLENFELETFLTLFDSEHYQMQMELYLTDDFMFNHLGEVGARDTAEVQFFYLKETLSPPKYEFLQLDFSEVKNFFELNKPYRQIEKVYFVKHQIEEVLSTWYFICITEEGEKFLGKIMLLKDKPQKIIGSVG